MAVIVKEIVEKSFKDYLLGEHNSESNIVINHLTPAYDTGKANNLDEATLLKYCCIALQNEINELVNKIITKDKK